MIGRPSHVKWYEYSYRQALANHSREASVNSWSDAIARIIFSLRCSKSSVDRVTGSLVGRPGLARHGAGTSGPAPTSSPEEGAI